LCLSYIGLAVFAGLCIIRAMYCSCKIMAVQIFTDTGALVQGDSLIFNVLPAYSLRLCCGWGVATAFFALMVNAG